MGILDERRRHSTRSLTVAAAPFLLHFYLIDECVVTIGRVLTGDRSSHVRTRRQEMKLSAVLASALLHVGISPTMIAAWKCTYEIAAELNDPDYRLRALFGLWTNCLLSGDSVGALDAARQFATLAPDNTREADLLVGERMLGLTLLIMGEHDNALHHIDHMLERYVTPSDGSHLARYQYDQKVAARSYKSVILWIRGLPDQAVRLAEYNIDEADAINHPPSVFFGLMLGACSVSAFLGDVTLSERFLDRAPKSPITLTWTDWVECLRGVLLIERKRSRTAPPPRSTQGKASLAPLLLVPWRACPRPAGPR